MGAEAAPRREGWEAVSDIPRERPGLIIVVDDDDCGPAPLTAADAEAWRSSAVNLAATVVDKDRELAVLVARLGEAENLLDECADRVYGIRYVNRRELADKLRAFLIPVAARKGKPR